MPRRTRLLLFGLPAALVLLGVVCLLLPRPRITAETIAKIRPGMTVADVEALLGARAGYTMPGRSPAAFGVAGGEEPPWMRAAVRQEWWVGDDAAVLVFFDAGGRVTRAVPRDVTRQRLSAWEYARWVLRF